MRGVPMNSHSALVRDRQRRALLLWLLAAVMSCSSRPEDNRSDAASQPAAEGKYAPASDEGLGASVAILLDNSGSMEHAAGSDTRPKYQVARQALEDVLATTDSFVAKQPDFPINVGLYQFSSGVRQLVPVQRYSGEALRRALEGMPRPGGGTAIGIAMDSARADLYRAGTIRKYILVVTDGENTEGPSPQDVAREIDRRSEGAVRLYFVAFDVDADKFGFLRDVHGEVLGASDGVALRASLDTIYRGRILAEATDAGETLPAGRSDTPSRSPSSSSTTPGKKKP